MKEKIGMAVVGIWVLAAVIGIACKKGEKKENGEKEKSTPPGTVKITAGCFMMGDAFNEGLEQELPVHKVCITKDFYLDKYEVTNGKFEECVKAGKCTAPHKSTSYTRSSCYGNPEFKDYPVTYVDWDQASAYCNWAGGRLPTEAEWEYAARGGLEGKRYPWGDDIKCGDANYGRYSSSSVCGDHSGKPNDTHKVGSYQPNGYGLYDMAGNVWEWTADWFDEGYYAQSPANDPGGPSSGRRRVLRGGCWTLDPNDLRVSLRVHLFPDAQNFKYGFRCARE